MTSLMALVVLGGGPSAHAAPNADSVSPPAALGPELPPGFGLEARSFQFPTGLRVIMQPDRSAPVVAITTFIDHGSSSDPEGKEGIAHFLEHMWFKSRHIEGSAVKTWDVLQDMGCDLNATTSMDWTNYMSVCPKEALPTLMRFASLRLVDATKGVKPEEADSEREVIRNELRMRSEGQFEGRHAYQYSLKALFPDDHPYNRLGIGTHDSLDNCSLEDITAFAEEHYKPSETTIVISGDFDSKEAGSLIIENFEPSLLHEDLTEDHIRIAPRPGVSIDDIDATNPDRTKVYFVAMDPANPRRPLDIENLPPVKREFGKPPGVPANRDLQRFEAPVSTTTAVTAWSLPPGYHGKDMIGRIASAQVTNSLQMVFWDEYDVVKGRFDLPETGCSYIPFQENSIMMCLTQVRSGGNAGRIAEKMLDQLTDIWNPERLHNPIARGQIERGFGMARNGFLQQTLTSMDRVAGLGARATLIGEYAHHTGDHQYYSNRMNEFGQIDISQILSFVEQYVTRERAAKFILEPLPADKLVIDSSESDYVGASDEDDQVVSMVADEDITPEVLKAEAKTPDFDKVVDRTLDNGLRVVIYPHGEAPLASIRLVSQGGSASTAMNLDGVVDRFATEGTGIDLEPLRIAGDWEDFSASGLTYTWLGIDAPSGNVDEGLWYLRTRVSRIKPDLDGKGGYVRDLRKSLRRSWQSGGYWRARLVNEAMGIDHPAFSMREWEHVDRIKKMKRRDIQAYLDRKYHPKNMTLVVVGAFDPEDAFSATQKYFGGWTTEVESFQPMEEPGPAEIERHEPLFYVLDVPRRTQTSVDATCRLANGGPDKRADRRVLASMLDGYLFQELRAKEGITYGSGARAQERVGGTNTLYMSGLFQNDGVGIATKTFLDVVDNGAEGEFPMNRFRPSQLSLARKPVLRLQAIEDVANLFASSMGQQWTLETWGSYGELIGDVSKESMQQAMEPCADTLVVTYQGPLDVIGPLLEEAGISYEEIEARELGLELFDEHDPRRAKKIRKEMAKAAEKEAETEAEDEGSDADESSD